MFRRRQPLVRTPMVTSTYWLPSSLILNPDSVSRVLFGDPCRVVCSDRAQHVHRARGHPARWGARPPVGRRWRQIVEKGVTVTAKHSQDTDHPPIALKALEDSELDGISAGGHWVTGPDGVWGWDANDDGRPDYYPRG